MDKKDENIVNPTLFDISTLDKSLGINNDKNDNNIAELALTTVDKTGNIVLDDKELKLHRDLSLYKIKQGKEGNIVVSKIKTAIFEYHQTTMRKQFTNKYSSLLENLLGVGNDNLNYFIENSYKNDFQIDSELLKNLKPNNKMIGKFYSSVYKYNDIYKKKYISGFTDEQIKEMDTLFIKTQLDVNPNVEINENTSFTKFKFNQEDICNIVKDIKEYSFQTTIFDSLPAITINFSKLCNDLGIKNPTDAKKAISLLPRLILDFMSINGNIEFTSSIVSSVSFNYLKKNKVMALTVQLSEPILKRLLLPDKYVGIYLKELQNMSSLYSSTLTTMLRLYVNVTPKITIQKNVFFDIFSVPVSCQKNSNNLKKRILDPAIEEVNKFTDMTVSYELYPAKAFTEIRFHMSKKRKVVEKKTVELEVIEDVNFISKPVLNDYPEVIKYIEKAKKNIYVLKAWNKHPKHSENKITKLLKEKGEQYTINLLNELYKGLKSEIQTTLVQYINGIMKNLKDNPPKKIFDVSKVKNEKVIKKTENISLESNGINNEKTENYYIEKYEKLDEFDKLKIEERALELCSKEINADVDFLLSMKSKTPSIYHSFIKEYIIRVISIGELK